MMAPYGTPYPPFCPPGGVYAHPGVQMVVIPSSFDLLVCQTNV